MDNSYQCVECANQGGYPLETGLLACNYGLPYGNFSISYHKYTVSKWCLQQVPFLYDLQLAVWNYTIQEPGFLGIQLDAQKV
jgi:hypothetical protein